MVSATRSAGVSLARRLFGERHPRVSDAANNLARVVQRLGDHEAAAQHYELALAIDQQAYGQADVRVAAVSNNYATCLMAGRDFANAAVHFEYALNVYEEQYGSDHPKVASVLNNLGCAMRDSDFAMRLFLGRGVRRFCWMIRRGTRLSCFKRRSS